MSGIDAHIIVRPPGTEWAKKSTEDSVDGPERSKSTDVGLNREPEVRETYRMSIEHLPTDIIGMVIMQHALLEWWAPAIDGAVCRLWRQTALGHPAVWAYVNIRSNYPTPIPTSSILRVWLDRAQAAPLTIRILGVDERAADDLLPVVLRKHQSIIVLDIARFGTEIIGTSFPILRHLGVHSGDLTKDFIISRELYPHIRSLHIAGHSSLHVEDIPTLRSLSLLKGMLNGPLVQQLRSRLTHLLIEYQDDLTILNDVIELPNLHFLSICSSWAKQFINAPGVKVLHEGYGVLCRPFPNRLAAVVEYGFWGASLMTFLAPRLQELYPDIERLSIVTDSLTDIQRFFRGLLVDTHLLANLTDLQVQLETGFPRFSEEYQMELNAIISCRNMGHSCPIKVHYAQPDESGPIPLRFVKVRFHFNLLPATMILSFIIQWMDR
jgi:hypothetical protein